MGDEIKIIDGKIFKSLGDLPTDLPTSCSVCPFLNGEKTFKYTRESRGYKYFQKETIFQCNVSGVSEHSGNWRQDEAMDKIFKTCPLEKI